MKFAKSLFALPACLLLALGTAMAPAQADSADPKLKALPEAVQKTVTSESPQGSIVSVEPKSIDGALRYKVALQDHGQNHNLVIDAGGKLLNTKTEVTAQTLPAPVRKTLEAQSQGARVDKNLQVNKAGKITYEFELQVSGHKKELAIEPGGELLRVEEVVPIATVPPLVKAAIDQAASRGQLLKVRSLTVKGKLSGYEAGVEIDGIKTDFKFAPDGKPLVGK
jgi:uncharacterized membrane protein YkoI